MSTSVALLETELPPGALDVAGDRGLSPGRRAWSATWPKLGAAALVLAFWQVVVSSGWKPDYLLPGPRPVLARLVADARDPSFYLAVAITMRRAVSGYALALLIGTLLGLAVVRSRVLRTALGSVITGLQTMPSIAWFPLAILLFEASERAILFVVVLGAAPAIANGLISGIDNIPPLLLRSGRVIGARGLRLYRHVLLPAALPAFIGGLKQGWAFAWRSLMAGELLVIVGNQTSLGVRLQLAREFRDAEGLLAAMIVILLIGMLVGALFGFTDRAVRRRWGVVDV